MSRQRDRELGSRLRDLAVPGEEEAEERARGVVLAAYADRTPIRPAPRTRRLAVAIAAGALLLAVGLSPAGAKVGELVEEVVGIGEDDAKPVLRSLPAAGELLVESEQGVWIVREDGSKRRLGDYDEATWSPRGLFVAAADGKELLALEPDGSVRWTIDAPRSIRDVRWSPSGFRIAYRSGRNLYVVAGDGMGARRVATGVAPAPPAWRPVAESKLNPEGTRSHVLSYRRLDGEVRTIDADSAIPAGTTPRDMSRLANVSPDGERIAELDREGGRVQLIVRRARGSEGRVLFAGHGRLTGPSWSPDGRWLLVGWPQADQWLFVRSEPPGRIVAIDNIRRQFDPTGTGEGVFPRVSAWVLPER